MVGHGLQGRQPRSRAASYRGSTVGCVHGVGEVVHGRNSSRGTRRSVLVLSPTAIVTMSAAPSRLRVCLAGVAVPLLAVMRPSAVSVLALAVVTIADVMVIEPPVISVVVAVPGR